jgi:hypothetical protein
MALNLIVVAITLLMAGFVLVWIFCPGLRPWMEAPKYRVLDWEQRFPGARRGEPGASAPGFCPPGRTGEAGG